MPFDLCYVIVLPFRIPVIPCCFCSESLFWPVFSYIIPWRPWKLCITLRVAVYMPTGSRWTTTEPEMVPTRDSNRHTEATTLAMYIPLHMVQLDQYLSTDCACDTFNW